LGAGGFGMMKVYTYNSLIKMAIGLSLIFLYITGFFECDLYSTNNFGVVVRGEYYRSAQLTAPQLKSYLHEYHIKSIINLRGNNQGSGWYDHELKFSSKNNIVHVNLKLKAYELPTKYQLRKLVDMLEVLPKPILIHCRSGTDRTGLAAALIEILNHYSLDDMEDQISWRYNALSYKTVGYQVISNYLFYLKKHEMPYTEASFYTWLNSAAKLSPRYGYFIT